MIRSVPRLLAVKSTSTSDSVGVPLGRWLRSVIGTFFTGKFAAT